MRRRKLFVAIIALFLSGVLSAQDINPSSVKKNMKRVADWQIEHFRECYSGNKKPHHIADWTNGALYVGMVKWAAMSDDDSYYARYYDQNE